jgi:hypothetical protein
VSFPFGLRPRPLDFVSPLVSLRDSSVLDRFCSGGGEGEGSVGVAGRFAPRALPRATGFSGCGAGAGLGAAAVRADLRTFSIVVVSLVGWMVGFQVGAQERKHCLAQNTVPCAHDRGKFNEPRALPHDWHHQGVFVLDDRSRFCVDKRHLFRRNRPSPAQLWETCVIGVTSAVFRCQRGRKLAFAMDVLMDA